MVETLMSMMPSSFMSPTKEIPASLTPVESMSLIKAHQRRDAEKVTLRIFRKAEG